MKAFILFLTLLLPLISFGNIKNPPTIKVRVVRPQKTHLMTITSNHLQRTSDTNSLDLKISAKEYISFMKQVFALPTSSDKPAKCPDNYIQIDILGKKDRMSKFACYDKKKKVNGRFVKFAEAFL